MGALPYPPLLTIEEFDRLEPPEGVEYELIEGVVYEVTLPRLRHTVLQTRIMDLFRRSAAGGQTMIQMGYQIRSTGTKRRADVAFIVADRWSASRRQLVFEDAPDLLVEVISPSNSYSGVKRPARLSLQNRCSEFWVVDPEDLTVTVWTGIAQATEYTMGETIPCNPFGIGPIAVREVFEGIVPDQD